LLAGSDGSPAFHSNLSGGVFEGVDGVLRVIEQLAGLGLPATLWESQILPARVRDYAPEMLDELLSTGEVIWSGQKKLGDDDGLVALHIQEYAAETLSVPHADSAALSSLQRDILAALANGGAWFAHQLSALIDSHRAPGDETLTPDALHEALWGLVWLGYITTDIWSPLRALSRMGSTSRPSSQRRVRSRRGRPALAPHPARAVHMSFSTPTLAGRWSLLLADTLSDTEWLLALADNMLDRYGIVSRRAVMMENLPGGFPAMQTVYRNMEDAGRILRGRFVEGMGGTQFAERLTIDRLRELSTTQPEKAVFTPVALSASDPANPFGTQLPWPVHPSSLVPTRRNGALIVIAGGILRLYLAQGGKKMIVWMDDDEAIAGQVFRALAVALRREPRLHFTLEEINDTPVRQMPLFTLLREVGFSSSPRGLDWG
jgi:ATP-dependent Lhr-like helicase